jgi:hypothetical protein
LSLSNVPINLRFLGLGWEMAAPSAARAMKDGFELKYALTGKVDA